MINSFIASVVASVPRSLPLPEVVASLAEGGSDREVPGPDARVRGRTLERAPAGPTLVRAQDSREEPFQEARPTSPTSGPLRFGDTRAEV